MDKGKNVPTYSFPEIEQQEEVVLNVPKDSKQKKWSELSPLEKIGQAASSQGVQIKKPNKSCNKCYGRGYVSVNSLGGKSEDGVKVNLPNPCKCIFEKTDLPKMFTGLRTLGRKERRKLERKQRKQKR